MKRFLGIACVLSALAAASTARAQFNTTNPDHVFTAIDGVLRMHGQRVYLTGVLEGAAGPTEVQIHTISSSAGSYEGIASCERGAVLMMNKPGQFKLQVFLARSSAELSYCRLLKSNP